MLHNILSEYLPPTIFWKKLELMLAIIFITIPPTLASQGTEFLATCQVDIQEWSP